MAPIIITSHGINQRRSGLAKLGCSPYGFMVHNIRTRKDRSEYVHPLFFYEIPYGFHLLRIPSKKLDELCNLVNGDWLNVVLNSFRILMRRYLLHSDQREKLRDYPVPRDYGPGHFHALLG